MKFVIDEEICKKKGLELPQLLAVLLVKTGANISELFKDLEKNEILVKDGIFNNYLITERWDKVCSDILLSADKDVPQDDRLEALALQLMELYPKGKKEGTNTYWRGNKREIRERLQKFFKLYGSKYTDNELLNATQKYVEGFNGQYSYMRVLKYFIWKDKVVKDSEDGKGSVVECSDLATYIENAGQEDLNRECLNEMR